MIAIATKQRAAVVEMLLNDTIIIKIIFHKFKIHFHTKRIFQMFDISKTNKMPLFCNLFIEQPSYYYH